MALNVREVLRQLLSIEPMDVPEGESGAALREESGRTRMCVPVLSVYLDARPDGTGRRPAYTTLRGRLREIERTFFPRGVAYDAVRADAARIERFLGEEASPAARGIAIFASAGHGLFTTLEVAIPFATQVAARPLPDVFQLARLLGDQEIAIVAVVSTHEARLFVVAQGLLREVRGLSDDPKFYHKVRGTVAMNQAHYQRYAESRRAEFARETADRIEQIVDHEHATHVFLAGEPMAVGVLREALSPDVARLAQEEQLRLDIAAPANAILEEIAPLLREAEADRDHTVVERLRSAIQAGDLGVAGVERTEAALERGQVDVLVLASGDTLSDEIRNRLIERAMQTNAEMEVVADDAALDRLGGVGALLRYRNFALAGAPEFSGASEAQQP